jgi:RHS repeat-associated protein
MKCLSRMISVALLILYAAMLHAQVPSSPASGLTAQTDTGTRPYIPYDGATENVNLTNGNINIKIPIVHLPGRDGFDLDLHLEYDSAIWKFVAGYDPEVNIVGGGWYEDQRYPYVAMGWHFNVPMINFSGSNVYDPMDGHVIECTGTTTVVMPDGARYLFSNNPLCSSNVQIPVMDTEDNTGAQFTLANNMLALSNGTKIYFNTPTGGNTNNWGLATKMVDANGNQITFTSTNNTLQSITDSVGRTITFATTNGRYSSVSYPDPNAPNGTATVSLGYTQIPLNWIFYSPVSVRKATPEIAVVHNVGTASPYLLTSLSIGGHQFTFNYDGYADYTGVVHNFGELTKITYPTGGYSRYSYQVVNTWAFVTFDGSASLQADFHQIYQKQSCPLSSPCATTTYTPYPSGSTNNLQMDVTYPDSHKESHYFTAAVVPGGADEASHGNTAQETSVVTKSSTGSTLRTVTTTYTSPGKSWGLPSLVQTTLENGQTKQETVQYDSFNATYLPWAPPYAPQQMLPTTVSRFLGSNVTQRVEYDWGASTILRKTVNTWLHTNPVNNQDYFSPTLRILSLKGASSTFDGSGTLLQQTSYEWDNYGAPNTLTSSGAVQHDAVFGTSFTKRGNLTSYKQCLHFTTGACDSWLPSTVFKYDDAGNITRITDPKGNATQFTYADMWSNGVCAPVSGSAAAYVTSMTDGAGLTTTATYNSCRGTIATITDPNLVNITYGYDQYGRRTSILLADGGQINVAYSDNAAPTQYPYLVTTTQSVTSSLNLTNSTMLDGFGRVCETQLTSDPDGATVVDTVYDGMGQKQYVTNPYRPGSLPTSCPSGAPAVSFTQYQFDGLGRVTSVTEPDGSAVLSSYAGNCTTITDEAGKQRKSCTDGLDRISKVFENPSSLNYETDYTYTPQGLACVEQHGGVTGTGCSSNPSSDATSPWRIRRFAYDPLGRLISAKNPESGTITYGYPTNSNLCSGDPSAPCSKMDARGITTTYSYLDGNNRLTGKSYSNGDAPVSYAYDAYIVGTNYGRGHRTSMQVGSASNSASWVYNVRGRASTVTRTISGYSKNFTYNYNLDGSVASIVYPSGKTVNYQPGGAGRTLRVWDSSIGADYVNTVSYAPNGALAGAKLGGLITLSNSYNSRLQPITLSATAGANTLMSRTYDFHFGSNDNGNVWGITDNLDSLNIPGRPVGSGLFSYDNLNRIVTAQSPGTDCTVMSNGTTKNWGNSYSIDAWGNLTNKTVTRCTAENLNESVGMNNQFTGAGRYDAAGNMISNNQYTFDAESRITSGGGSTFAYDGDGNRVAKLGGAGELHWMGVGDETLSESGAAANLTSDYIYFDGKRIARFDVSNSSVHYYIADHLGSATVIASASGAREQEEMYYPYGGERWANGTDPSHYKFTGKERDSETGLDYFGARYYGSNMGRFLSPDEFTGGPVDALGLLDPAPPGPLPYADITNPQSLNKYSYTYNNPLAFTDPDGHCPMCIGAILGAGAGGGVILYKTGKAVLTGKGSIPDNKEIVKTLLTGAVIGATFGEAIGALQNDGKSDQPNTPSQPDQPGRPQTDGRPEGVPDNWTAQPTKKGDGTEYVNPENPHDRVRDMPGNPNSPNPAQQQPYVKWQKNGQPLDKNGAPVDKDDPASHIPRKDFKFKDKEQ